MTDDKRQKWKTIRTLIWIVGIIIIMDIGHNNTMEEIKELKPQIDKALILVEAKIPNPTKGIDFIYDCSSVYNKKWYDCPINSSFQNLTGQYCESELICQNTYKIVELKP